MSKTRITDFWTYRWRYQIGYGLIVAIFIALLTFAALYVPGGLSDAEMTAVGNSPHLSFVHPESLATTNLPYDLLQKATFNLLGVTNFSVKLPALILAILTGIGAVLLLRQWYRPNVAVLATAIMITTGQFLFVAQLGTASISYVLWPIWLLLAGIMVTRAGKFKLFWKMLFAVLIPLSLYTPLSIYLVVAILSSAILHPHIRLQIRRTNWLQKTGLFVLGILALAPLGYLIWLNPNLGWQLLGIPTSWPIDVAANLSQLAGQYLSFITPTTGALMTPFVSLGAAILIVLGIIRLVETRYTARSYTITAWTILLIPVIIINPKFTTVTFVPLLLLLASGIDFLLRSWYRLFPRNPYARIAGLVPLTVLVFALVFTGVTRYVYGYHYDPQTVRNFNFDLTLLNYSVRQNKPLTLVTTPQERDFYLAVAYYAHDSKAPLLVVSTPPTHGEYASTRAGQKTIKALPSKIVTSSLAHDADRFYLYKDATK